ncbi:hypothetical protein Ddye_005642 [Dipteronia dyeriana]|uniref:Uncharacterized protein n=1 Tax=Dipteronia dyeriana TaxID=168575 RepID=A0AAE0CPX5_9ROSI|nr:hypothetical protein Ddye_005642 [Dipteronia dyeriana]
MTVLGGADHPPSNGVSPAENRDSVVKLELANQRLWLRVIWRCLKLKETKLSTVKAKRVSSKTTDKLADLEEEVARLKASLRSSENKLSQSDERLTHALERLKKATYEAMNETQGKLMHEYLLRHTNTWEAEKDIKTVEIAKDA